jgi:hypothetical protein
LNIAEGNGKPTEGERRRFFEIARGSTLECAAIQDVLDVCGALSPSENANAKKLLNYGPPLLFSLPTGKVKQNHRQFRRHSFIISFCFPSARMENAGTCGNR